MTWLIIEDFMEEVSFKLGQGLDFTVGDSCGVGKRHPGLAKGPSAETQYRATQMAEESAVV